MGTLPGLGMGETMIGKCDADRLAIARGAVWEARSPSGLSVMYFDSEKRKIGEYFVTGIKFILEPDPQVFPDEFFACLTGLQHLDTGGVK